MNIRKGQKAPKNKEDKAMEKLIEQATANWETLNKGERTLAKAAVNAKKEGLYAPTFGLGVGSVVWDDEIAEIVKAAKTWNIATVLYASGQSDSVNTLGLFTEAGAAVDTMQKLTLKSTTLAIADGEMKKVAKTVWAFEINIF
jgi:hypothetical protein